MVLDNGSGKNGPLELLGSPPNDASVPADIRSIFEPYEARGITFEVFLWMSAAERAIVHDELKTSSEIKFAIERAAAESEDCGTRLKCESYIVHWFERYTSCKYLAASAGLSDPLVIRDPPVGPGPLTSGEPAEKSFFFDPNKSTDEQASDVPIRVVRPQLAVITGLSDSVVIRDPPVGPGPLASGEPAEKSFFFDPNKSTDEQASDVPIREVRPKLAHRFSGLVNQSSTCYLNALLQALFHLPQFRREIYGLPLPPSLDPKAHVSLALQQLFLNLERGRSKTKTTTLTAAFGWGSQDAAVQHDIHELVRKLLDVLEAMFDHDYELSRGANPIRRMFSGSKVYYTKCIGVPYTSHREELFYDVELVVKGHSSIGDSLVAETTAERLDGTNRYCWEHDDEPPDPQTGKPVKTYHDADRGAAFRQLPPVLMIHPNRLDFDYNTLQKITVNSEWRFGTVLDMEPYMMESDENPVAKHVVSKREKTDVSTTADDDVLWTTEDDPTHRSRSSSCSKNDTSCTGRHLYELRSVVVHSGAASYGHYYCFVRFEGNSWVKFNDEHVTDSTFAAMSQEAFGGMTSSGFHGAYSYPSSTRASLLVYVRSDLRDTLLQEIVESDIPAPLLSFFESNLAQEAAEAAEQRRLSQLSSVPIIVLDGSEQSLELLRSPKTAKTIKLAPDDTFGVALADFSNSTFWVLSFWFYSGLNYRHNPRNHAVRVHPDLAVSNYFSPALPHTHGAVSVRLLLVVPNTVAPVLPPPTRSLFPYAVGTTRGPHGSSDQPCLLIVYELCKEHHASIVYRGVVQSTADLVEQFFPEDEEDTEAAPKILIETGAQLYTVKDVPDLASGDIVVLVRPSVGTIEDCVRAFDLLYHFVDVTLYRMQRTYAPVGEFFDDVGEVPEDSTVEVGVVRLLESDDVDALQQIVADYVQDPSIDPRCIAFRAHDNYRDAPQRRLATRVSYSYHTRSNILRTVKSLLSADKYQDYMICKLYFEVLPMPWEDFELLGLREYVASEGRSRHCFFERQCHASVDPVYLRSLCQMTARVLRIEPARIAVASSNVDGYADQFFIDPDLTIPLPNVEEQGSHAAATGGSDHVTDVADSRRNGVRPLITDQLGHSLNEPGEDDKALLDLGPVNSSNTQTVKNLDDDEWAFMGVQTHKDKRASSCGSNGNAGASRGSTARDDDLEDGSAQVTPSVPNPLSTAYPVNSAAGASTPVEFNDRFQQSSYAAAASPKRSDIIIPYVTPTYLYVDSLFFIVTPEIPPPVVATTTTAPVDDDAYSSQLSTVHRWLFVGVQSCGNRLQKDYFGFATAIFINEADTGEDIRRRVVDHLRATPSDEVDRWTLWAAKLSAAGPLVQVTEDVMATDLFSFDHPPLYFSGSLIVERPLPSTISKTRKNAPAIAEPELRINNFRTVPAMRAETSSPTPS